MENVFLPPDGDPLEHAEKLIGQGDPMAAAAFMRRYLDSGRGALLSRLMLVRALLAADAVPEAILEAREASCLYPNVALAALALGETLLRGHYLPAAIGELQRALRLDPDSLQARLMLGGAWLEAGEADRALEIFSALPSGTQDLAEKIGIAEAIRTAPRSDPRYVRHLFDQFSHSYDQRMRDQLGYAAPEILLDLAQLVMPGRAGLSVLDLGCGTGFAGEVFRHLAARLEGIDLSPAMIEKARARNVYDQLTVGDIEALMGMEGPAYDLILAADTLVYLGSLAPLFGRIAQRLSSGGFFLFTVERHDGEFFVLGPKRRWQHAESYLRHEADLAGLTVAGLVEASPRREGGIPVPGFAVALSL